MGTDLIGHIEYQHYKRPDGTLTWHPWANPFFGRNYVLFALLAGVRSTDDIAPVIAPRGFPNDLSPEVMHEFTLLVVNEVRNSNQCTHSEAEYYVAHGASRWVVGPENPYPRVSRLGLHTPSWLTTAELIVVQERFAAIKEDGQDHHVELDATIAAMKTFDPELIGKARLMFWFLD